MNQFDDVPQFDDDPLGGCRGITRGALIGLVLIAIVGIVIWRLLV